MIESLDQLINLPIIPVILLPVTGLLSLVFYNRATAVNQRIRFLQKELRDIHLVEHKINPTKLREMRVELKREINKLHTRSNMMALSLICCLLSIVLFSLCALFIALGLFYARAINVALVFWFIGPFLISIGGISGIIEIGLSLHTIKLQTAMIEKWNSHDDI